MPLAGNGLLGLTTAEATRRLAEYGPNVPPQPPPVSIGAIILRTLKEPMFFLLMAAAVLYLALGDLGDRELLEVAQQHHFQVMGRQGLQGVGQVDPKRMVRAAKELFLCHLVG